jgi:hypothetical protein
MAHRDADNWLVKAGRPSASWPGSGHEDKLLAKLFSTSVRKQRQRRRAEERHSEGLTNALVALAFNHKDLSLDQLARANRIPLAALQEAVQIHHEAELRRAEERQAASGADREAALTAGGSPGPMLRSHLPP